MIKRFLRWYPEFYRRNDGLLFIFSMIGLLIWFFGMIITLFDNSWPIWNPNHEILSYFLVWFWLALVTGFLSRYANSAGDRGAWQAFGLMGPLLILLIPLPLIFLIYTSVLRGTGGIIRTADWFIFLAFKKEIHKDKHGILYHGPGTDENRDRAMVRVEDANGKRHWIRVSPSIQTAERAVAASYGLSNTLYEPKERK